MKAFYLVNSEIFGLSNSTAVVYNFLCRVNNVSTGTSYYKRRNIAHACNVSEISTVMKVAAPPSRFESYRITTRLMAMEIR